MAEPPCCQLLCNSADTLTSDAIFGKDGVWAGLRPTLCGCSMPSPPGMVLSGASYTGALPTSSRGPYKGAVHQKTSYIWGAGAVVKVQILSKGFSGRAK